MDDFWERIKGFSTFIIGFVLGVCAHAFWLEFLLFMKETISK